MYTRYHITRILLRGRKYAMKRFLANYWICLKTLPKNPFFYVFILLILTGEHTPIRKVLATVIFIIILPVFHMWSDRLRRKFEKPYIKYIPGPSGSLFSCTGCAGIGRSMEMTVHLPECPNYPSK